VAWRRWVKRLVPPVLLDLARGTAEPGPVWRGVYAHLRDVPVVEADFSDELIDEMVTTAAAALTAWRAGTKPLLWHEPFALVAGAISSRDRRVRVIDFGGGVGSGYVQLMTSLPPTVALDYLVVDSPAMCEAGRRLFPGDSRIRFDTELPHAANADVVYVNSVLQYIDDYRAMLRRLAALGAGTIFLARLAAGSQPTFASEQLNVPGRVFSYWFVNVHEVIDTMEASGYDLACDSFVDRAYDQSNLPETHRVERFRNLLFVRRSQRADA
jgi:putative methyltransferase (TIGR04325 family)